jgi:putative DNA methylase
VKPQIMPYYVCDGPNSKKGKWFRRTGTKDLDKSPVQSDLLDRGKLNPSATEAIWKELPATFDVFSVPWQERKEYRYEGPEIIYSFWAKHGPCQREGCGHRTPIMPTPVVAIKTLTVDAWTERECTECGEAFDVERHRTRMAPDAPFFVAPNEKPFAVMDDHGFFACPHCGNKRQDKRAFVMGDSSDFGKAKSKKVELTLLVQPSWLEGCPKHDEQGREYGGTATDSVEASLRWNKARAAKLRLLEARGPLPEQVTCPESGVTFYTTEKGGTIPKRSTFACAVDGSQNDVLEAIKHSGKTGALAPYAVQGIDPTGDPEEKFFAAPSNTRQWEALLYEWEERKDSDLKGYWPTCEVPYGFMTHHLNGGIPNHGFTHWWKMFNPRQLLVHSLLLKAIATNKEASAQTKVAVLGVFQQYLRNNNLFCFWNMQRALEPMFSNNNFHPKSTMVESSVFTGIARGDFAASAKKLMEAAEWSESPWEIATFDGEGHSEKIPINDRVLHEAVLECSSASELSSLPDSSHDLVVTDPPFGGLLHYAELSDFFYVWLRLVLKLNKPDHFTSEYTPKALEAVSNEARRPGEADEFYQRILTDCWREAFRVLKPGGILAFTFHHSEDEPWVGVLESLFDAGFYLEATYPIRSDETKGEGEFGSKKIEYDIIHVCRKRLSEPQAISWARLRRLIVDDVRRIKDLLSQHQKEGLPAADLQVIKRGKALEYFSRHYGKVFIEQGREFTIREALVGINQLLDDDTVGVAGGPEAPPSNAEPYTRQFFRLFYETTHVPRDQMQKFLRGTGIAPSDFEERGWCSEKNKVFTFTPPIDLARAWKGTSRKGMARDFDQAMFLVGGCIEGSSIRVTDTLESPNFAPHPATAEIVDWLTRHGGSQEIRFAAQRARTIYRDWLGKNKAKAQEQMQLFDLEA